VPPQLLAKFGVAATTNPAGSVSVNATPVRPLAVFGFWTVTVSDVVPFIGILGAPKALLMLGGTTTGKPAVVVPPLKAEGAGACAKALSVRSIATATSKNL
jgi:hypothetical protein